jgi:hypothetical protein
VTGRPGILHYSVAALVAVILLALGARLGAQSNALGAARSDLADAERSVEELKTSTAAASIGPPLLDAKLSPPEKQLEQLLLGLGVSAPAAQVSAVSAAGPRLVVARLAADGKADATALDRVALWAQANPRSVILERFSASAGADGRSDVHIVLDVLVRGMAAPAP